MHRMEQDRAARWSEAVAETIRAERAAARMTQAELARRSGLSRVTYIRYETGERIPNVAQVAQIASGLGMRLSSFLAQVEARVER